MIVLAHRGLAAGCRENTVEAFSAARRQGADGVELDVRLSADGAVVVHHDAVVEGWGPVSEFKVSEMPEWVPLLETALDVCEGIVVNVEIKSVPQQQGWDPTGSLAGRVATLLAERPLASVLVSSFSLGALETVRRFEPRLATAWLTLAGQDQLDALAEAASLGCRALNPHHLAVTEELVTRAHAVGVDVNAWTVDDPGRAVALQGIGVDAVISNRPELVMEALRR